MIRFRAHNKVALVLLLCLSCLSSALAAQQERAAVDAMMDTVVSDYRTMLLLTAHPGEKSLSNQKTLSAAAWEIRVRQDQQKELLLQMLVTEIDSLAPGTTESDAPMLGSYLDYLSLSGDLNEADRLAFLDISEDLLWHLESIPADLSSIQSQISDLMNELNATQARYGAEIDPDARFNKDGVDGRKQWNSYLETIKPEVNLSKTLDETTFESDWLDKPQSKTFQKSDAPKILYGYQLPPKTLVLTIDDGPHARRTPAIMKVLDDRGIKAYFFQTGNNVGTYSAESGPKLSRGGEVGKRLVESGHQLANHSFSHPNMAKLDDADRQWQIESTNELISLVQGMPVTYFRPPYGASSKSLRMEVQGMNMISVLWNVDSRDWADPIPESITQRVVEEVEKQGRGILLFHDIHRQTVQALPMVIDELLSRGYTFTLFD